MELFTAVMLSLSMMCLAALGNCYAPDYDDEEQRRLRERESDRRYLLQRQQDMERNYRSIR